MTSLIRVGHSQFSSVPIDEDAEERITNCLQTLAALTSKTIASAPLKEIFLHDTSEAYSSHVARLNLKAVDHKVKDTKPVTVHADDLISFRQFAKKSTSGDLDEVGLDDVLFGD